MDILKDYGINNFEQVIINIIFSACDKISSATILYSTGYGFNLGYFACILAQEELAKLIMLPFIYEIGELEQIENRKHPFFNHAIKQKIFTSFGLQNRTHEELEKIKQSCMYVGINKEGDITYETISKESALKELSNAANLLFNFSSKFVLRGELSKNFHIVIAKSTDLCIGLIREKIGDVAEINKDNFRREFEMMMRKDQKINGIEEVKTIITNPFTIISLFKFIDKNNYKKHLSKILKMNIEELTQYIIDNFKELKDI